MTPPDPVPLLSGHCVLCGYDHSAGPLCNVAKDILSGRAKVCPVMTEQDSWLMFANWLNALPPSRRVLLQRDAAYEGWLALARHLGLVAENTETGS